jgi:cobalamin biosynthesis Mg chelatase CobN
MVRGQRVSPEKALKELRERKEAARVAPGCLHPDHQGYFASPADYMRWYQRHGPVQDPAAPTVAVLLYRKHVITDQVSSA